MLFKLLDIKSSITNYEYGFVVDNNREKYLIKYVNGGISKDWKVKSNLLTIKKMQTKM